MQRLSIDLGERSYDILIGRGLRKRVGEFLKAVFDPSQVVVITHPSINILYLPPLIFVFNGSTISSNHRT